MIRLLFTSGHGPAECRMALAQVLRRLHAESGATGCECDIAAVEHPDGAGPGSAVVVLSGDGAEQLARRWTGGIVWVCKSPLRPRHPRKNWFVDAFELPPQPPPPAVSLADVRFESFRAGGPGGQHQNKTESAVRAIHVPTGVSATAREERSQHRNRALALGRLEALLDLRARLREAGEERLIHGLHRDVRRGAAALRFEGVEFKPV
ncbi:peptide chain release factor H (plasmid) [Methylosinus trichosporium OB3b]|uniref:Peptide chain release factor H n=1 Tax=Methylosinus trichosporium (strain ATCC 35070 / NCIMB 11131 / UNIQEM 75 / OB3b) TaxID=595536 RepID=A0A2D2D709_METT3|nr:peptide chain release factor H [Methylosinus trichosporium]ATQ70732.1 peptide chain release factor H [Methylosinus trichosporium OB3b]